MKEYNIKNLKVEVDLAKLFNTLNSKSCFDIDIDGNIYPNNTIAKNKAIIFSSNEQVDLSLLDINSKIKNIFGQEYKPKIVGNTCILTPLASWMKILDLNKNTMLYFDHQSDGIEIFEDPSIEDIGWQAVAFDIKYRDICNYIEKYCQGTILFYDNDMHFNGFVVAEDIEEVKEKILNFIRATLKDNINNKRIDLDELDDDQSEALEFFGLNKE